MIARAGAAAALVGLLVWKAGLFESGSLGRVEVSWFLAGFALVPIALALRAFNHGLLLNRDSRLIGFADLMRLTLVGAGIGLIVPMGAADLLKARYGLVVHGSPEKMVVSTVVDKLTSLTAVAAMGSFAAALSGRWAFTLVGVLLLSASLVPVLLPSRWLWSTLTRLVWHGAHGIDEDAVMLQARPDAGLLARVYVVSAAGWLVSYLAVYAACRAAAAEVGIGTVLALAPVMTIARLVPVSIGGIGVGEATLAALLVSVGVPVSIASLASLLQLILLVLAPGAAGLVVLSLGRVRRG